MALDWMNDFLTGLDQATGAVTGAVAKVKTAVDNVASSVPVLKNTNAAPPATPPQGEITQKTAQTAYDTAKPATVPWGLVIAVVLGLALVEWG